MLLVNYSTLKLEFERKNDNLMEERINKIFIMLDKYCKEKDLFKQLDIPSLDFIIGDFDKTKQLENLLNLKKDDLRDEISNELIWLREKMIQTNRSIVYR